MTGKRGTTLIEAVIAVAVVAIAITTLLEALNVGITGTLELNRKVSALNLAKSELEYVKSQTYNASTGDLGSVYGLITSPPTNIRDTINYNISGQVSNVNANSSLQQITVNVSYLNGKHVQLTGFKTATASASSPVYPPSKGQIVSDVIEDMPFEGGGGWALGCLFGVNTSNSCGTYTGYYHVFQTGQSGYISATWKFNWVNEIYPAWNDIFSWGAPYIGIYEGTPAWVNNDAQGNVEQDGVIFRPGCNHDAGSGGCMPNSNESSCNCDTSSDSAPIIMHPTRCAINSSDENWEYEGFLSYPAVQSGSYEFTVTTPNAVPADTYTVLFFNGEDRLSYNTVSATVTYVH